MVWGAQPGDVWFIKRPSASTEHPTQKPVELVERALRNSSKTRDSGSGLIVNRRKTQSDGNACKQLPIYQEPPCSRLGIIWIFRALALALRAIESAMFFK